MRCADGVGGGRSRGRLAVACASAGAAFGCAGAQSSLAPAGREAEQIAALFWWMAGGTLIVWLGVLALTVYCMRSRSDTWTRRASGRLIVWGGVVFPTAVLTVLLIFGLTMLPPLVARAPEGSLRVDVVGELWWWRVRYHRSSGPPVDLANEIRLPVGEPVQLRLESDNVIHSFWIPSLGGKMDMIPGRITWLALRPTTTGVMRGACAEYCGTSHALMGFHVEVMERAAFDRWLDGQAAPARPPAGPIASRGRDVFFASGCSACHAISGTPAAGTVGPDLTHVGSRATLAAGVLRNDAAALERWIARTADVKPGVHMPRFGMLPRDDLAAVAAYLWGLQ
jgi:cytochrome c oxidase subunit 2